MGLVNAATACRTADGSVTVPTCMWIAARKGREGWQERAERRGLRAEGASVGGGSSKAVIIIIIIIIIIVITPAISPPEAPREGRVIISRWQYMVHGGIYRVVSTAHQFSPHHKGAAGKESTALGPLWSPAKPPIPNIIIIISFTYLLPFPHIPNFTALGIDITCSK
jgi:hypothetical protein